jgi:hypothetical protein
MQRRETAFVIFFSCKGIPALADELYQLQGEGK